MAIRLPAQSAEDIVKILEFTGYDSPENLDEELVERLSEYLANPLKLNVSSVSQLRSSGLMTAFQAASLIDYRNRHGAVMSLMELSSVDGFTDRIVSALAPFISLGGEPTLMHKSAKVKNDLAVRTSMKSADDGGTGNYAMKYRFVKGEQIALSLSCARSSSSTLLPPDILSGNITWEPRNLPLKITAGDFNVRFGQGLTLWNGFSMSGLSKVSSFRKSPTGISSSWSFTGSSAYTGVGAESSFSRFRLISLVVLPEIKDGRLSSFLPAMNLGWYGKNMYVSATHYMEIGRKERIFFPDMKTSADISMCIDGVDLFSEVSLDWVNASMAGLAGLCFPAGENIRIACNLRFYPPTYNPSRSAAVRSGSKCSNEYGTAVCVEYLSDSRKHSGSVSIDGAYFPVSKEKDIKSLQVKLLADYELKLSESLSLKLRLNERLRTWGQKAKTDLRADLNWEKGSFLVSSRLNAVRCIGIGVLAYLEGGYRTEKLSIYLKQGYYRVDNWDDRIYSYERDAPGGFSVPAFYGRGLWTSVMASWKFAGWGRAYVIGTVKPGNAGLKLQCVFSF